MGAGAWDKTMSRGKESEGEDLCDPQEMGPGCGELCYQAEDETGGLDLGERREWRRLDYLFLRPAQLECSQGAPVVFSIATNLGW